MDKIKKSFAPYEVIEERTFLERQSEEGYMLHGYDGETYVLVDREGYLEYLIIYRIEAMTSSELAVLTDHQFMKCAHFQSRKGGYYYYFARPRRDSRFVYNDEDRIRMLTLAKNRLERFNIVIVIGVIFIFANYYSVKPSQIYLVFLLLSFCLAGYILVQRKKLVNAIRILTQKD